MQAERPLFIPLRAEFFDAFADGSKREELRPLGPRWNERTCRVGRDRKPQRRHGWIACYGSAERAAILIGIELERGEA